MKATCLLKDSIYSLAISDKAKTEKDVLGLRFTGVGEAAGGDDTTTVGSVGGGGVSEVSIRTGSWASKVDVGFEVGTGTFGCALPTSDVLASDPGAGLS